MHKWIIKKGLKLGLKLAHSKQAMGYMATYTTTYIGCDLHSNYSCCCFQGWLIFKLNAAESKEKPEYTFELMLLMSTTKLTQNFYIAVYSS